METLIHPGGVDLHDHFRWPSQKNTAEDYQSGTQAAAVGGYVVTNDMPNTPGHETWTLDRILEKEVEAQRIGVVPIGVVAGAQPEADNVPELPAMMNRASSAKFYLTRTQGNDHEYGAEDFREQTQVIHETSPSKLIMVHAGEDNLGEVIEMVADEFKHPLHVCHINNPEDVSLVTQAKRRGLQVTCGVTPHHLFKSSFDEISEGWFARMKPPLAEQGAAEELFAQLSRGEIDCVETDHAPHSLNDKWKAEHQNPLGVEDEEHAMCFGVTSLEFTLPLLFYQALRRDTITMERVVDATHTIPGRLLGINFTPKTSVTWDIDQDYRIDDDDVISEARWTPFQGKLAVGRVVSMNIGGKAVMVNGKIAGSYSAVVKPGLTL